jgi:hypothetical protein
LQWLFRGRFYVLLPFVLTATVAHGVSGPCAEGFLDTPAYTVVVNHQEGADLSAVELEGWFVELAETLMGAAKKNQLAGLRDFGILDLDQAKAWFFVKGTLSDIRSVLGESANDLELNPMSAENEALAYFNAPISGDMELWILPSARHGHREKRTTSRKILAKRMAEAAKIAKASEDLLRKERSNDDGNDNDIRRQQLDHRVHNDIMMSSRPADDRPGAQFFRLLVDSFNLPNPHLKHPFLVKTYKNYQAPAGNLNLWIRMIASAASDFLPGLVDRRLMSNAQWDMIDALVFDEELQLLLMAQFHRLMESKWADHYAAATPLERAEARTAIEEELSKYLAAVREATYQSFGKAAPPDPRVGKELVAFMDKFPNSLAAHFFASLRRESDYPAQAIFKFLFLIEAYSENMWTYWTPIFNAGKPRLIEDLNRALEDPELGEKQARKIIQELTTDLGALDRMTEVALEIRRFQIPVEGPSGGAWAPITPEGMKNELNEFFIRMLRQAAILADAR